MNNDSKLVRVRHLESVVSATKDFVINQIDNIATGSVLDTVPATVNGGLWFELDNSEPVIKFHYGSNNYQLSSTIIQELDPELAASKTSLSFGSGPDNGGGYDYTTISYLGSGTITVSANNSDAILNYNSSTKQLQVSSQQTVCTTTFTITVSLSAAPPYSDASITLSATAGGNNEPPYPWGGSVVD